MIWLMAMALAAPAAPGAAPEAAPAAAAKPTREAEDLGLRLARANVLAAVAPVLADKEIDEVVQAHPEWTPDDVATYRSTARRVAGSDINRIIAALGHAYARNLSMADLTQIVAVLESPAAAHRRAVDPIAFREALRDVGTIDFKRNTLAAFCAQMGKGCTAK